VGKYLERREKAVDDILAEGSKPEKRVIVIGGRHNMRYQYNAAIDLRNNMLYQQPDIFFQDALF